MPLTSKVRRRTVLKLLALTVPGAAAAVTVARNESRLSAPGDPLRHVVLEELAGFTTWLEKHQVSGYIGEVGWPDNTDGDAVAWNQLANAWFEAADRSHLWVSGWAAGEWWDSAYKLAMYRRYNSDVGVDTTNTQASVLEAHASTDKYLRGIAVAGGSFGASIDEPASDFSNLRSGTYDVDYHYDAAGTFQYLAQRGQGLARLDFRWERIQPAPGGALDEAELARLDAAVGRAGEAGLKVVLDLHNYGAYYLADGERGIRQAIGTPAISAGQFADLWQRLSSHFASNPYVVAYGLMNEPTDLPTFFNARTTYPDLDASPTGWLADNSGPEVLSRISTSTHGGTSALKVARAFPGQPAYGQLRVHDNGTAVRGPRDLSADGDTLALWVYLPAETAGSGWQARLFVNGARQAFDASSSITLQPGNWTQVTGQFTPEALSNVRAVGIQVYCNAAAGPAWIALDGLAQGTQRTPAQVWEAASQSAVEAIRAAGDRKLVAVGGYGWSKVQDWARQHPTPWIHDADNVRYEAHHYWDHARSGFYARTYAEEASAAGASS